MHLSVICRHLCKICIFFMKFSPILISISFPFFFQFYFMLCVRIFIFVQVFYCVLFYKADYPMYKWFLFCYSSSSSLDSILRHNKINGPVCIHFTIEPRCDYAMEVFTVCIVVAHFNSIIHKHQHFGGLTLYYLCVCVCLSF